jgi:peptidoglycan/xylan/chitin deacetylase (PgdA/CDA1 family)
LGFGASVLKIAFEGSDKSKEILGELLSPWDVSFCGLDEADIAFVYKKRPVENKKSIIIPSSDDLKIYTYNNKLKITTDSHTAIQVPLGEQTSLTVIPQFVISQALSANNRVNSDGWITSGSDNLLLATDVIQEFNNIFNDCINVKPSKAYSLLTRSPLLYSIAPKALKNIVMRQKNGSLIDHSSCAFFSIDALRLLIVRAIEELTKKKPELKASNKKKTTLIITHDIDSSEGLKKAIALKKIEEKYNLPSVWYLPSNHYPLDLEIIKELANFGEIGAHDTKHDGKLIFASKAEATQRVLEAKERLENITGRQISGFRAPLLQHNPTILQAIKAAGYIYDSSVPAWEPKHPCTMKPHGIGTTFMFQAEGLVELPITLPQDHQMLTVSNLTLSQTVEFWFRLVDLIKDIGGFCVLLVHPDYQFAHLENGSYEEILSKFSSDNEIEADLPSSLIEKRTIGT